MSGSGSREWRFLVDEDTHADTVDELRDRGHNAVSVQSALGRGRSDCRIAEFARTENRVLITTDRDFLRPELHDRIRILLVTASDATGDEIATKVAELARLASDPVDLKPVTWI